MGKISGASAVHSTRNSWRLRTAARSRELRVGEGAAQGEELGVGVGEGAAQGEERGVWGEEWG